MAYNKVPTESVYQTKQVPLMFKDTSRSAVDFRDTLATNVVWEPVKSDTTGEDFYEAIKREGVRMLGLSSVPEISGKPILGIYFWETKFQFIAVGPFGTAIVDMSSGSVAVNPSPVYNFDRPIGFTEFLYDSGEVRLIYTDGQTLTILKDDGTNNSYNPVPTVGDHCPNPIFLDGYLFLADLKGNIWNSALNDPTSWPAANVISAEAYGDTIEALARVNNYIVAFGRQSIEYFYDAGNPTGTVLAPMSSASRPVGIQGDPVVYGDSIYFIGKTSPGNLQAMVLKDTKLSVISTPTVQRKMNAQDPALAAAGATEVQRGSLLTMNGHNYFCVSRFSTSVTTPISFEYAMALLYDLDTGLWSNMILGTSGRAAIRQGGTYLLNTGRTGAFIVDYADDVFISARDTWNDVGIIYPMYIQTNSYTFGNNRQKILHRIALDCDRSLISGDVIRILTSVNDGIAYYSNPPVTYLPLDQEWPVTYGQNTWFRRIQFGIGYESDGPMRVRNLEIDYLQGDS